MSMKETNDAAKVVITIDFYQSEIFKRSKFAYKF